MERWVMKRRKSDMAKAAALGALLGLGAPLGYFLFSFLLLNPNELDLLSWISEVGKNESPLLFYLTVPTVTVFTLFGLYHGRQEARLAIKTYQMDRFLNIAAHDIRNPLAAVREAADLLELGITEGLDPRQKSLIKLIHRQMEVVLNLLEELLDLHKIEIELYHCLFPRVAIFLFHLN